MEYEEDLCQDLNYFLAGNLVPEYFSDIEELRQHWENCENCHTLLPDVNEQIKQFENLWLSKIQNNIARLYREHCAAKEDLIKEASVRRAKVNEKWVQSHPQREDGTILFVPPTQAEMQAVREAPSEDQQVHSRFLVLLAEKGQDVREQLQIMNDNWGLDYFRLALNDNSCQYDSRVCGALIMSLSTEVQYFAFQSIAAADILQLFDGQCPPKFGCALYLTVERATPEFLRLYLDEQEPSPIGQGLTSSVGESEPRRDSILFEKIARLSADLGDIGDSLKAGQMEVLSRNKPSIYQESEIEEDIINHFGKELFTKLGSETQQLLRNAEVSFRRNMDENRPAVLDFQKAYECEFRHRITGPLVQELIQKGHTRYPSANSQKELIKKGIFNWRLGLGDQLWFLLEDQMVRSIVSALGVNIGEIHKSACRINKVRNEAAHRNVSRTDATAVRDTLRTALKALFPQRKSK